MANQLLSTIDAGANKEIRFEIERTPRETRLSMRLWMPLVGLEEKAPTGRAITLDRRYLSAFKEALIQAEKVIDSAPSRNE